jgi:sugar fermentation stimulation protein A
MMGLNVPNKPGVYTLVIELASTTTLTVGGLGAHCFPAGVYTYTGSALGKSPMNLRRRIQHHLTRGKRKHWHIDYLLDLDVAKVKTVLFVETVDNVECEIAKAVARLEGAEHPVKGFGSSDCRSGCKAHLCCFQETSYSQLVEHLTAIYHRVGSPQKGVEESPF